MLTDAFNMWSAAGRAWMDAAEMTLASAQVVGARMPLISAAAAGQSTRADRRELGRMVTEKVSATATSATRAFSDIAAMQTDMLAQWQALGAIAMSGSAPSARQIDAITRGNLRLGNAAMKAGAAAMAPFHASATANAKRLGRKKRS